MTPLPSASLTVKPTWMTDAGRRETRRDRSLAYLAERTGTYEYRCLRYAAAWNRLEQLGLAAHDLIVDVGAGMCDLDRYGRTVRAWDGRYLPVDGAIDGTDLNTWHPTFEADFYVALELIEQLEARGYEVRALPLFGKECDTLLAWRAST